MSEAKDRRYFHQQPRKNFIRMVSKAFTRNALRITGLVAFVAILVAAVTVLHVQNHIGDVLDWIEEHKIAGAVSYIGLYALFTVLPVPAAIMSLAAGAIFGLPLGSLLVWLGAVLGEIGCIVVGRLMLREWVASMVKRYQIWQAVEAAVAEEGWKMVLLLRCSPIIPFALLNYFLSLTSITFWDYTWASALGIVPGVLAYVYIGSLANDVSEIISGRTKISPTVTIVSAVVSGVFIIAAFVIVTVYAKRAIDRRLPQEQLIDEDLRVDVGGLEEDESAPLRASGSTSEIAVTGHSV